MGIVAPISAASPLVLFIVGLDAGSDESPAWAVLAARLTSLAIVLVAVATTHGAAGTVGVLSALYPIVTVLLARFVLREHLGATKRVGCAIALGGAALVTAA